MKKDAIKVDRRRPTRPMLTESTLIGDVIGAPWLAHKASHEGVNWLSSLPVKNRIRSTTNNIPGCTYCEPQVASVGLTEEQAKEEGYDVMVGKFPFSASGKATGWDTKRAL
jgi:dihydrolipoamide dehydrogenase